MLSGGRAGYGWCPPSAGGLSSIPPDKGEESCLRIASLWVKCLRLQKYVVIVVVVVVVVVVLVVVVDM